jgi:hypothetical protein
MAASLAILKESNQRATERCALPDRQKPNRELLAPVEELRSRGMNVKNPLEKTTILSLQHHFERF